MLEGRGVNQTDTWIKTPGRRLVHFSDKPTIRPLKQRLKHSDILGDWIAKDLLEGGCNIRPVWKLVLTGT